MQMHTCNTGILAIVFVHPARAVIQHGVEAAEVVLWAVHPATGEVLDLCEASLCALLQPCVNPVLLCQTKHSMPDCAVDLACKNFVPEQMRKPDMQGASIGTQCHSSCKAISACSQVNYVNLALLD